MTKSVVVNFNVEMVASPDAGKADHFTVNLAGISARVPLTDKLFVFQGLVSGTYDGFVAVADVGENHLAPAFAFQVVVPEDAMMPVPVSVDIQLV
jgi:hypothetical protein